MNQTMDNFNFGGGSGITIFIFVVVILGIAGYIIFKYLRNYLADRKKFGWIYELSESKDFTKSELQDLKECAAENDIKNADQLYRVLHSVKMLSSTRRKLYFDDKDKKKSPKEAKKAVKSK